MVPKDIPHLLRRREGQEDTDRDGVGRALEQAATRVTLTISCRDAYRRPISLAGTGDGNKFPFLGAIWTSLVTGTVLLRIGKDNSEPSFGHLSPGLSDTSFDEDLYLGRPDKILTDSCLDNVL